MDVNNNQPNQSNNGLYVAGAAAVGGVAAGGIARHSVKIDPQKPDVFVNNYKANLMEEVKKGGVVDGVAKKAVDDTAKTIEATKGSAVNQERLSGLSEELKAQIKNADDEAFEFHFNAFKKRLMEASPDLTEEEVKTAERKSFNNTIQNINKLITKRKNDLATYEEISKLPQLPKPKEGEKCSEEEIKAFFENNRNKKFGCDDLDSLFSSETLDSKDFNPQSTFEEILKAKEEAKEINPETLRQEISALEGVFEKTPSDMKKILQGITQEQAKALGLENFEDEFKNATSDDAIKTLYAKVAKLASDKKAEFSKLTTQIEEALKLCNPTDEASISEFLEIAKKHPDYASLVPVAEEGKSLTKEEMAQAVVKIKNVFGYEEANKSTTSTIKTVLTNMTDKAKQATDGLTGNAKEFGAKFADSAKTTLNQMKTGKMFKFGAIGALGAGALAFVATKFLGKQQTPPQEEQAPEQQLPAQEQQTTELQAQTQEQQVPQEQTPQEQPNLTTGSPSSQSPMLKDMINKNNQV